MNIYISIKGNSTKAIVEELRANALYYFKLRATTSKGPGPASRVVQVNTLEAYEPGTEVRQNGTQTASPNDRQMGIIVGVSIGGACIIICAVIIILRNK